jgi:hypothetical protein
MSDTKGLIQNRLAIAAKIVSSAPILAKQVLAEIVGRRLSDLLTLELFADRIPNKGGKGDAARYKMGAQVCIQLRRQANCNSHAAAPMCSM